MEEDNCATGGMPSTSCGAESALNSAGGMLSPSSGPESTQPGGVPRKGILKRPMDRRALECRYELPPTHQAIPSSSSSASLAYVKKSSPDRVSRIPKLSVTWWEKNAVAFFGDTSDENNTDSEAAREQQQRREELASQPLEKALSPLRQTELTEEWEEEAEGDDARYPEENFSVASSTESAASSIVGRWWMAKDTRYVPHCEKRGCNHANHEGEYLTPTQRRNKEMTELKKQLRKAISERDEKDKHLMELRNRIDHIEKMNEEGFAVSEKQLTMAGNRILTAAHEAEKKALEKRHAIRVNQLIRETMQAREEVGKLTFRLSEYEAKWREEEAKEFREEATNTMEEIYFPPIKPNGLFFSRGEEQMSQSVGPHSSPLPLDHPTIQQYITREAANKLQASMNEAFIWRSKAAQLEIVVRDHLTKANKQETTLSLQLDSLKRECERLRHVLRERENENMADSGIENPAPPSPQGHRPEADPVEEAARREECSRCAESAHSIQNLQNTIGNLREQAVEFELTVTSLTSQLQESERLRKVAAEKLKESVEEMEKNGADRASAEVAINRLHGEKDTLQKALSYMEERLQVYQNTITDHELVVTDENPSEWRKGFVNPRYRVCLSKRVQTSLTCSDMEKQHNDLDSVQKQLKILDEELSSKNADVHSKFVEIEANLRAKTQLVETLTRQLDESRKEIKVGLEKLEKERELHRKAVEGKSQLLEKISFLEREVTSLQERNVHLDMRMGSLQDEYEKGLEDALQQALTKYTEQSRYWKDKVAGYDKQLTNAKNEVTQLRREKEEQRLKSRVDRAEMERKLASSIAHVQQLSKQVNRCTLDAECEAKPKTSSKYVACRPHSKAKETQIERGDLMDESEEKARVAAMELATTKRQMHVLQQKLIDTLNEKQRFRVRSRGIPSALTTDWKAEGARETGHKRSSSDCYTDGNELMIRSLDEASTLRKDSKREAEEKNFLRNENRLLQEQLTILEEEKDKVETREKQKIMQLVEEFDTLRKELDQEMGRYASEKKWLKSRIFNLEKSNSELQKMLDGMERMQQEPIERATKQKSPALRKTKSEEGLNIADSEAENIRLRSQISFLKSELVRVREALGRTASAVSTASSSTHFSPAIAELVTDLNHVKKDLEKALEEMEGKEKEEKKSVSPTRLNTILNTSNAPRKTKEESPEQLLNTVMCDWNNDEIVRLAKDLKRSRQERQTLKLRIERLSRNLREATNELELYRRETAGEALDSLKTSRSRSTVDLTSIDGDHMECARWKEKAGTMFRELIRLRTSTSQLLSEKRDLRLELAMLRGELELARCQPPQSNSNHPATLVHKQAKNPYTETEKRKNLPSKPWMEGEMEKEKRIRDLLNESIKASPASSFLVTHVPSEERNVERVTAWIREPTPSCRRTRSEERRRRSRSTGARRRAEQERELSLHSAKADVAKEATTALVKSSHDSGEKKEDSAAVDFLRKEVNGMHERLEEAAALLEKKDQDLAEVLRGRERDNQDFFQKLSSLQQQLAESNSQLRLLSTQTELYDKKLKDMEEERREMYLVMFKKGQEAASMGIREEREVDSMTEDRVVLRFLHDAFYYFMLNRGDSKEHLQAIMTMLNFTPEQKEDVTKRRGTRGASLH